MLFRLTALAQENIGWIGFAIMIFGSVVHYEPCIGVGFGMFLSLVMVVGKDVGAFSEVFPRKSSKEAKTP